MDCNDLCSVVFKYGGYWNTVKGQSRIKYVCGSQKTLKFKRGDINLFLLKECTEALCTWIRGHEDKLHYHVNETSPKIYMPILNDTDVMDMLTSSCDSNRIEVVIVVKDHEEYMGFIDNTQFSDMQNFSVNIRSNNDIIVDGLCEGSFAAQVEENNSLCVGSRFEDASIRKINSTHLCPRVNRARNKQASTSWIAHEIKDLVKRNPDIAPKDISNNLETTFNVDIEHVAFISDMEKGLGEAIKLKLAWSAANCYNIHEYDAKLEQLLLISPQVHSYLTSLTCKWSKATFSKAIKNHYNTNNMVESFNSGIEEARSKPVVDLIDIIRGMLMEQRSQRKLNSNSWKNPLVPCVEEYIRDVTTRKEHFIIRWSTPTKAEVEGIKDRHEVDIESTSYVYLWILVVIWASLCACCDICRNESSEFVAHIHRRTLLQLQVAATGADHSSEPFPVVVSTWPFVEAVRAAWRVVTAGSSAVDAVVEGCSTCEELRCDGTVNNGGRSCGCYEIVKDGIKAAKLVMEHTDHTLIVGEMASIFAISMGLLGPSNLSSPESLEKWIRWKRNSCQPNFRKNVIPTNSCGPYSLSDAASASPAEGNLGKDWLEDNMFVASKANSIPVSNHYHDTISMAVIDKVSVGTSTNGATFKIPGSYQVVESMRRGMEPKIAAADAMSRIARKYPDFVGAIFALNKNGVHAGACHGWTFQYSVRTPTMEDVEVFTVVP
ncbi:hypothetical protein KFK09_028091 [Dendrobium nobile]|uniref:beta-aspartyl-peptidase n=1 Tax=Dendrobium nobile TaxID=94219 RepID=A0A8T3A143_DENNO|nr:hypothetical protein KFK09_028091 [Dendrobium nobile]